MNNLSHLQRQTAAVFSAKVKKFTNLDRAFNEKNDFDNHSYNSYLRYLETGDGTHINRVLEYAKHVNRYREFKSLYSGLIAHRWTSGPAPMVDVKGKASKKKLARLRETGETEFLMKFGSEQSRQQTSRGFDLTKRVKSLIAAAEKNGLTVADVMNELQGIAPSNSSPVEGANAA